MLNITAVSMEPSEIVKHLKKGINIKEVSLNIWQQKIIDRAAQQRNLTVTPEEIQAEANRQRYEKRLEKSADTLAWLADQLISPDDWEAGIRDRLLYQKLAESLFAKEVEKFFAQNKLDFQQLVLYQILVPYEKLGQEIFYQIEEEEISFYEAAHFYDIDERRRLQCGYEGKLYRWSLKPELAAVVFSASPKQVVGPIKTELGYHLLMVEEFIAAALTPDIYKEIMDRMFKDWIASELNYMLHNQAG
jgi:parvulin-like peptidyl-prolyl isomerase